MFCKTSLFIEMVQIDNQTPSPKHPVVLHALEGGPGTHGDEMFRPFLSIVRETRYPQLGTGRGFETEHYVAVSVQPLGIKLDAIFITDVVGMWDVLVSGRGSTEGGRPPPRIVNIFYCGKFLKSKYY